MIISCPSCATRYDLPASRFAADSTMIKCASCGHSWLEARAIEAPSYTQRQLPAVIEHDAAPEEEIRRLVEASREAQDNFAARRRQRRKRLAAWAGFAAVAASPLMMAMTFPEQVVRIAPAAISAYKAVGRDINIYGLDVRRIEMQHILQDGTRVLTVKGEIANTSGSERKIPSLRFGLRDAGGKEVYQWTLDSGARPLMPGESTSFVTRVASPPETAKDIQIRFAHADEIGLNQGHD
jgi:predicted Zn finger-like uncharacterized protein